MARNLVLDAVTLPQATSNGKYDEVAVSQMGRIKVFVMDLWCYIPYYDRYLCEGLMGQNMEVALGAVSPYLDPEYFGRNGLANDPGLADVVPKLGIPYDVVRRVLMLVESCVNMAALLARFAVSRPDIVHVQWIPLVRKLPFEMWFLKLLKRMGIKLVYTVHNVLPHDTGKKYATVFESVYGSMDALICHNEEAKNQLVREFAVDSERIWVIPHGPLLHDAKRLSVEAAKQALSLPPDETVALWQGMIRPYKGLDFLLESWRRVDAKSLKARLIIAGTGEPELLQAIKERVTALGLQESVRLDFRYIPDEELPTYYQAAEILVYPYREVTTSGALMTALAYGKAIVATNLPVFQEVLRDNETALQVDYGDAEALAGALSRLIRDSDERERLAFAVAALGDHNSWSCIAKKTRQCYASVLQNRGQNSISR